MALNLINPSSVPLSPLFTTLNDNCRPRSCAVVRRSVAGEDSASELSRESVGRISGASSYDNGGKRSGNYVPEELEPLWDDGYGTQTINDYTEIAMDLIKRDGGPPRWFCPVACGKPLEDSPLLLYLPGIDGIGAGLVVHEKALGKVFHIQCLHIPVWDRTPLEGLIQIVEDTLKTEHNLSPDKPIYLLGESFGGALALAVAARNPRIDLTLILANPATSFERSMVLPLIPFVKALPKESYGIFPYAVSPLVGDFVKVAEVKLVGKSHLQSLSQFPNILSEHLEFLSVVARILPKETHTWRLKLVESAAAYANSRLHAITAQVMVLASGKDKLLPSKNEAKRLSKLLKHCTVRVFEENGHTILMESGVNVLSAIKKTQMYRRSLKRDILNDFLPLSMTELKSLPTESWGLRLFMDAVFFSTMEDGNIVRGLAGIPDEGPVLVVGNHMLLAIDLFPVILEFLRAKKVVLHGLAHPEFFNFNDEDKLFMMHHTDALKLTGVVPVTGRNLFRLLGNKSYILLYPGGVREALHRKGEACKLFWPDQQEFVRMAVKLGATIIPYAGVGEDDMFELIADYNDMKRIPFVNRMWDDFNQGRTKLREEMGGEIANQQLHLPGLLPKIPGRLYFMFGKPVQTKGKENMLEDKDYMQELYLQIKCEVEKNMAYLLKKREDDPYRSIVERIKWQMNYGTSDQIPSFKP